ncbi:MAG: tetratricopeptide repeat protein, partial [Candidatus Dadabacteria bacterium]|nr:tetratricopeptide repeat protein [Candidatus Dadabacteria bacterium]
AYRYFLKGKEACNLHSWTEARKNLEKALEIDPAFGMAYVYLAWTYVDPGPEEAIAETLEKAKTLADKSSQKDALYFDGLYAYFVQKDTRKAVQRLDELIRRYPDEKWAFHISGDFIRKDGDLEGAYGRYKKWLDLDPQDSNALYHLSNVSLMMGNLERAEEYIKRHETVASPDIDILRIQALIYRGLGQLDNAIAKYIKIYEIQPERPQSFLVNLYSFKEDYEEARKWADLSVSRLKSPGGRSNAYLVRGDISLLKGALVDALTDYDRAYEAVRTEASLNKAWAFEGKGFVHLARREYEAARQSLENMRAALAEFSKDVAPEERIEWAFDMGMLQLGQGQVGQAKARLSEILSLLPEIVKEQQPEYHLRHELLQGEILLVQGKLDEALACAKKACGPDSPYWRRGGIIFIAQSYYMDLAARTYARKGDTRQAISEYERLLGTNFSTGFTFPVHPLYRYRLGLLYEKTNDSQNARSQLERFLLLWKDADPGAAEVEDAKKRLAALS